MTPRGFDTAIVQVRLTMMRDLLDDLESLGEMSAGRLEADRLLRHAVERVLGQLVELAVAVNSHVATTIGGRAPDDYRSSFDRAAQVGLLPVELAVELRPSVGMRNVLAHEYAAIDLEKVAAAIAPAIRDYGAYVTSASRWLKDRSHNPG